VDKEEENVNATDPADAPEGPTIESLTRQLEAQQDRYVRLAAEFDNFRKRTERDLVEHRRRAADSVLLPLLEVVDNLDRALAASASEGDASLRSGLAAIRAQLGTLLDREGACAIEAEGRQFDPFEMEAVMRMPSDAAPEGMVVRELQRGYRGRSGVLRTAKVIVSAGPAASTCAGGTEEDPENGTENDAQKEK
jgi:molecular chaperone GrpE